jgi:hypothetical protein
MTVDRSALNQMFLDDVIFTDIAGNTRSPTIWLIHTNGSTTPEARSRSVVYSADLGQ